MRNNSVAVGVTRGMLCFLTSKRTVRYAEQRSISASVDLPSLGKDYITNLLFNFTNIIFDCMLIGVNHNSFYVDKILFVFVL